MDLSKIREKYLSTLQVNQVINIDVQIQTFDSEINSTTLYNQDEVNEDGYIYTNAKINAIVKEYKDRKLIIETIELLKGIYTHAGEFKIPANTTFALRFDGRYVHEEYEYDLSLRIYDLLAAKVSLSFVIDDYILNLPQTQDKITYLNLLSPNDIIEIEIISLAKLSVQGNEHLNSLANLDGLNKYEILHINAIIQENKDNLDIKLLENTKVNVITNNVIIHPILDKEITRSLHLLFDANYCYNIYDIKDNELVEVIDLDNLDHRKSILTIGFNTMNYINKYIKQINDITNDVLKEYNIFGPTKIVNEYLIIE